MAGSTMIVAVASPHRHGPTKTSTPTSSMVVGGSSMDVREMDAARALLMGPYFAEAKIKSTEPVMNSSSATTVHSFFLPSSSARSASVFSAHQKHGFFTDGSVEKAKESLNNNTFNNCSSSDEHGVQELQSKEEEEEVVIPRRPRSASETLDYLAALAELERCAENSCYSSSISVVTDSSTNNITSHRPPYHSSSDDDDSDAMPPPPPRFQQQQQQYARPRSTSNPESMDRWNAPSCRFGTQDSSSSRINNNNTRRHFVLPASILAVELQEARVAAAAVRRGFLRHPPPSTIPEEEAEYVEDEDDDDSSHSSQSQPRLEEEDEEGGEGGINCYCEENISPGELLRQARSRLLEDLSESSVTGEKGILTLPHALAKYKEVSVLFDDD